MIRLYLFISLLNQLGSFTHPKPYIKINDDRLELLKNNKTLFIKKFDEAWSNSQLSPDQSTFSPDQSIIESVTYWSSQLIVDVRKIEKYLK